MATIRENRKSTLILRVETGTTSSGTKYANRTINSINPITSDTTLLGIGTALAELQTCPLSEVQRTDKASLVTA